MAREQRRARRLHRTLLRQERVARRALPRGNRIETPVLVSKTHTSSGLTLVYRVGAQRYRVQVHGSGKSRYAVIQSETSHRSAGLPSPDVGAVAVAVRQELANLARTGGGAIGRLAQLGMLPTALLVLALGLVLAGLAARRVARAMA